MNQQLNVSQKVLFQVATGITTEAALFNHFVKFGIFEGRACCEGFNVAAYKSSYSDLQAAFGDDIVAYYVQYVTFGQTEKRALVTVEAATAAGVTVKSAADGTVVAAGAAKPAAGSAAASSGSAASGDANASAGSNSGASTSKASSAPADNFKPVDEKKTVSAVTNLTPEMAFNDGYDYDYANRAFYQMALPNDTDGYVYTNVGYVKDNGKYYEIQSLKSGLKSDTKHSYKVKDYDKYYNVKVNKNTELKDGLDPSYWLGDEDAENPTWYWIARWNEEYKKANGDWNLKDEYFAVDYNGYGDWHFFSTKTEDVKRFEVSLGHLTRVIVNSDESTKIGTVRHASVSGTEVNVRQFNGDSSSDLSTAHVRDASATDEFAALTLKVDGYTLATPKVPAGYICRIANGVFAYEYNKTGKAAQYGNGCNFANKAYREVTMKEACARRDGYVTLKGKVVLSTETRNKDFYDEHKYYDDSKYTQDGVAYSGYCATNANIYAIENWASAAKDGWVQAKEYKEKKFEKKSDHYELNEYATSTTSYPYECGSKSWFSYFADPDSAVDANNATSKCRQPASDAFVIDSILGYYYRVALQSDAVSPITGRTIKWNSSNQRYYYVK